ncbi:hypothetical protein JYT28_00280 [Desulfobulbus sp. AH-315-M07]|nr:hypothetical protein [Desulfobulbus sp. AH-315-M07]
MSSKSVHFALLAAVIACSAPPVADDDDFSSSTSGAGVGNCGVAEPPPLLETDVVPIFNQNCMNASHCHSSQNYFPAQDNGCRGGLSLQNEALGSVECPDMTLRDRLLQLSSEQCAKQTALVVPCRPEASYLLTKLTGGPYCSGESMPLQLPALSAADAQTLRDWISSGAGSADVAPVSCDCSE